LIIPRNTPKVEFVPAFGVKRETKTADCFWVVTRLCDTRQKRFMGLHHYEYLLHTKIWQSVWIKWEWC